MTFHKLAGEFSAGGEQETGDRRASRTGLAGFEGEKTASCTAGAAGGDPLEANGGGSGNP